MPPSEDLTDEVEAINSIYGDGTLVLADGEHSGGGGGDGSGTLANLAIPRSADDVAGASAGDGNGTDGTTGASTAHHPPVVLGVQSVGDTAGHRRPGAAAHDAEQFGAALATAFQEGQVCLFDAVEEFLRQKGEEVEEGVHNEAAADDDRAASPPSPRPSTAQHLTEPPPWVTAEPVVELKSTFLARCAAVRSPAQAAAFIQHLKDTDRRVRTATHNMTAWRIRDEGTGVTYQDCDDDGETAAGGRLLHLMQLMGLWNVVVVVTRWYGGHKLGPRRFALINQAARDAFVQAGLVAVAEPGKKKR
ncbi:impact family protein [Sporothrix brasiliensis 5110]|uniref:Impact family protein n=1 Tax=Sporothrix brasiliensis 5110 TaxID=1398154 RepID=A0A0C2J598_9PEZI|nr:impact family protein [Sporothrix brasiliensis 5110]KIH94145.1 impact family protein [Sporothrix brasiliensis 5110]